MPQSEMSVEKIITGYWGSGTLPDRIEQAIAAARREENEACAKVAEACECFRYDMEERGCCAMGIAAAIRARIK